MGAIGQPVQLLPRGRDVLLDLLQLRVEGGALRKVVIALRGSALKQLRGARGQIA